MRRALMTVSAIAAVLAPGVAAASVISESVPVNIVGSGLYEGSIDVPIAAFDSSLGTLRNERLRLSGTFTPGQQWQTDSDLLPGQTYPTSVPVTLTGNIGLDVPANGPPQEITLAAEMAQAVRFPNGNPFGGVGDSYIAIGTPEPFTITDDLEPAALNNNMATVLAWTDLIQPVDLPASGFGDLTQVHGTLTVTYVYAPAHPERGRDPDPVPEPASLALLGFGVLGLGLVRRRR